MIAWTAPARVPMQYWNLGTDTQVPMNYIVPRQNSGSDPVGRTRYGGSFVPAAARLKMGATMTRGQYLYGGALGGALIGLFTTWLLKGKGAAYLVGAGIGAGVGAGYGFLRSL